MTPTDLLQAAADKLDALLAEVYPLPWSESPVRLIPHRGIYDAADREIATVYEETEAARVSALIVALGNAGPALVGWLRFAARGVDADTVQHGADFAERWADEALTVARAILGGES